jgi:nuclear GTP-binding protein
MPKKSTKSKSKRQTLKHKYKVLKKVKEHHRKKRKEANKSGQKNKGPKEPGIPNSWPFKEELIQQMAAQRERAAARQTAAQVARRAEIAALAEGTGQLQGLQAAAASRGRDFAAAAAGAAGVAAAGGAYVDSSRKAFYKEFVRVVEASDVVIEVLDARDPAGSRCLEVERFARRLGPNKKIILLLNKIDLVPREVAESWLRYLREELPAVAFKCSTQRQAANLGRRALPQAGGAGGDGARGSAECLGADTLLQLLKNFARGSTGLKASITVGVVGLPNVGKSSLINSLKRARVAQVGNTPGVTRAVQEVHLDKQLTLLDSPGVVFADAGADGAAAAALRNCVKVEQLEDPALPVAEIVRRCPAKQLMQLYKVPAYKDADEFLQHVAAARGKLRRGGAVDAAAAARIVLQDWNDGRIPYYTVPPTRESEVAGSTVVVPDWGASFDAEAVFAAESSAVIAGLPSLEGGAFFQTQSVGAAHIDLDGMAREEKAEAEAEEMGGSGSEDDAGGSGGDAMDAAEAGPAPGAKTRAAREKQNVQLYAHTGQLNPHAARADRKRRKKGGDDGEAEAAPAQDYDFGADWGTAAEGNPFDQLAEGSDSEAEDME